MVRLSPDSFRLSESNARQTATQIGQLLLTYSKNGTYSEFFMLFSSYLTGSVLISDVKVVLTQSIFGVCLAHDLVPQRLVMEYCLLLAMVHSSVSAELCKSRPLLFYLRCLLRGLF